jgi:hypothetical protein
MATAASQGPSLGGGCPVGCRVQEGLEHAHAARVREAFAVHGIERDDRGRLLQRSQGGPMAQVPGAAGPFDRHRGLGHQIGDGKGLADGRADPVGGLVVEMVGQPGGRALACRPRLDAAHEAAPQRGAERPEARLAQGIARAVAALQSAG